MWRFIAGRFFSSFRNSGFGTALNCKLKIVNCKSNKSEFNPEGMVVNSQGASAPGREKFISLEAPNGAAEIMGDPTGLIPMEPQRSLTFRDPVKKHKDEHHEKTGKRPDRGRFTVKALENLSDAEKDKHPNASPNRQFQNQPKHREEISHFVCSRIFPGINKYRSRLTNPPGKNPRPKNREFPEKIALRD
jgi:hypothetical protein